MTISFPAIPSTLRTPLFFADLDNSQANGSLTEQKALLVTQMLASGTATPGVPVIVAGDSNSRSLFGRNSMGADSVLEYRKNDSYGELWVLPVLDNPAGVVAVGSVTFSAPATAPGTLNLYVGGNLIQIPVATTQTVTNIAAALALAINANPIVTVTAAAVLGVVTLTATHAGLLGNDIDIRLNYQGTAGGETTPAGLTVAIAPMAGGTGNPIFDVPFAAVGDQTFDFIGFPYTDATSLAAFTTFSAARWAWDKMQYGGGFSAIRGTVGALSTYGATLNGPHISVMGFNDSPSPVWRWSSAYCGASAVSLRSDPGLPLQTVALSVMAPPLASRFNLSDRNVLLWDGISTYTADSAGQVRIETAITTYQRNAFGDPDDSYLYVERMYLLAHVIRYLRTQTESRFARIKLADDGTVFRAGAAIVTPKIIRASLVAWYRDLEFDGMVQDSDVFAANLLVQRSTSNRCRVDCVLPVIPIDQLRQLCALVQFRNSVGV